MKAEIVKRHITMTFTSSGREVDALEQWMREIGIWRRAPEISDSFGEKRVLEIRLSLADAGLVMSWLKEQGYEIADKVLQ